MTPSTACFNARAGSLSQACALDWVRAAVEPELSAEDVLAIDGKQLCGSGNEKLKAVHMLNVWSERYGLCLTSTAVDGKSNEITSVPGLLDTLSLLDLAGCIVSVDARNTQRKVANKVKQHKAEEVVSIAPVADYEAAKVTKVSKEPFNLTLALKLRTPMPFVAPQLSTVLRLGLFAVSLIWGNHLNVIFGQLNVKQIAVIRLITD